MKLHLNHESYYTSYARLLLSFGLAFRPGQKLLVELPAEAAALAERIEEEARRAGASSVVMMPTDDLRDAAQMLEDPAAFQQTAIRRKQTLEAALEGDVVSLAFLSPVPALDRMLHEEQKAAFFRYKN